MDNAGVSRKGIFASVLQQRFTDSEARRASDALLGVRECLRETTTLGMFLHVTLLREQWFIS